MVARFHQVSDISTITSLSSFSDFFLTKQAEKRLTVPYLEWKFEADQVLTSSHLVVFRQHCFDPFGKLWIYYPAKTV